MNAERAVSPGACAPDETTPSFIIVFPDVRKP